MHKGNKSYQANPGKRIKIQANYECLQARHSCKAQGGMRVKPEMKPWVNRGHKNYELRRRGTNNASIEVLVLGLLYCSIILSSGYPDFIYLFFAPLGIISLRLLGVSLNT